MSEILVRMARDEHDVDAARSLCREWLDWHWKNYPPDWPRGADHPMDPAKFRVILEDLPQLHGRPTGGILVGYVDGTAAGCVMYGQAGPGVAEFKRMFVSVAGRGHGLGRALLEAMFERMASDGYDRVFFSSAVFLTHARAMYENAGFVDMPHPQDFPLAWRDKVYFMERALV
jgi:GNAT superfamily N-acetyltransferase